MTKVANASGAATPNKSKNVTVAEIVDEADAETEEDVVETEEEQEQDLQAAK